MPDATLKRKCFAISLNTHITSGRMLQHSSRFPRMIVRDSGLEFSDMMFFDNEIRNVRSVASLGVHCVFTPDGLTTASWEEGLRKYAEGDTGAKGNARRSSRK